MTSQGKTRLKVWLVLLGVFALGSVTGALLSGAYFFHRLGGPRGEDAFFKTLQSELNLNDQQSTEVRSIINDARNDYHSLREEARPRFEAIRKRERERIRALLSPDQQQRFDQMIARQDARHDERDRREPGGRR